MINHFNCSLMQALKEVADTKALAVLSDSPLRATRRDDGTTWTISPSKHVSFNI